MARQTLKVGDVCRAVGGKIVSLLLSRLREEDFSRGSTARYKNTSGSPVK